MMSNMKKHYLLGIVCIILLSIVLYNHLIFYELKATHYQGKWEQMILERVTKLARILGVPRTFIDLSIGKTELKLKEYEETPISAYLIRPKHILGTIHAEVVDSQGDVVARMDIKECKSLLIAKFRLLERLSDASASLEIIASGQNKINSVGNIGIMKQGYVIQDMEIMPELRFVRGGTIVELEALSRTADLLDIAKAIDRTLLWAIWRKWLLWICIVVSLLAVLDLCVRKRTSWPKKILEGSELGIRD